MAGKRYQGLAFQFFKFGLGGVLATAVNVGIYYVGVQGFHADPNLSWCSGFGLALVVSYLFHSRWVFNVKQSQSHATLGSRFFAVALFGFAVNSGWVWLLATYMKLPTWTPIPLILFVTPVITFLLNRLWVFR